jgi:hypothetical protein
LSLTMRYFICAPASIITTTPITAYVHRA